MEDSAIGLPERDQRFKGVFEISGDLAASKRTGVPHCVQRNTHLVENVEASVGVPAQFSCMDAGARRWRIDCKCRREGLLSMPSGPSLVTFRLPASHAIAVWTVRQALRNQNLRIPAEMNLSSHLKEEFGAVLAPSVVLYVDDPALLLEALVFQQDAALLLLQPVVIAGGERHSEILVRSAGALLEMRLPNAVKGSVLRLHAMILEALAGVAKRDTHPQAMTA